MLVFLYLPFSEQLVRSLQCISSLRMAETEGKPVRPLLTHQQKSRVVRVMLEDYVNLQHGGDL